MADPWAEFRVQAEPAKADPWADFRPKPAMSAADTAVDVAKSAAIGVPEGVIAGAGTFGDLRQLAGKGVDMAAEKFGVSPETVQGAKDTAFNVAKHIPGVGLWTGPTSKEIQHGVEGYTGEFYKPQSEAGKFANVITGAVSNPTSYLGPGSVALKAGGAALAAAGSEAAGKAAEGTGYETPARIAGALAGGVTGAKALGPTFEKAAIPSAAELKAAGGAGYDAARASGLELHPQGVGQWAAQAEQDLTNGPRYAFTGGPQGTARKTLAALERLQNAPAGSTITASNLDTLRTHLGDIAGEVQPSLGGFAKPTADAKAATLALERLKAYTEGLDGPYSHHVVAGDPKAYVGAIKEANGNWAAGSRLENIDARLTKAEHAVDRQVAGSRDSQIKGKVGALLDNPERMRGMSQAEKDQVELINKGTLTSNVLRQAGRGGAGVVPLMGHLITAASTGGASLPYSIGIGLPLYAARKGAEAMTKSRAQKLADMLGERSPLYDQRAAAIKPTDTSANKAAILRALLTVR